MPSYAVLGATGKTGQSLIRVLLQSPDNQIHAYCRSKQKLTQLIPDIETSESVKVFEGSLNDVELLANCIRGTSSVFMAVAVSDNVPGCTIAQDTAHVVISALEKLDGEKAKLPKLIVLSSASLEHATLMKDVSAVGRNIALAAFSNIYADLRVAEEFLRSKEALVSATFIKPGVLSHDTQKGHALSTETSTSPVSFLDLAAGMVEVAESDTGQYDMKNVSVNPTASDVAFPWYAPLAGLTGLLFHFFPWTYRYLG